MILDHCAKWTERMYSMTEQQIEEYIDSHGKECNRIVYIEYSYKQIGLTEKWFEAISAKIGQPLTVRREILLQRLHGSSSSPYPQEDIEYIVSTEHKPIDEMWLLDYYKFDIYKELRRDIPYLVGIDCSTGTNSDNNAITILNPYTLEVDAEFENSYIGETLYENLIKELCKVIPRCVLCIERNSVGDGIIDHLLHSPVASRLYFDKNKDLMDETMKMNQNVESLLKKQAQTKTFYGVYTNGQSRESMFAILARHVAEFKDKFVSHNVIRDLSRLVVTRSGKIEAGPGFHDDSIMSYLIALYVYYHGNNLGVFGITRGMSSKDEPENKGLKRPEDIDPTLVSADLINGVKESIKKEKATQKELGWDSLMKSAIQRAQQETYNIREHGMIENTLFDNTKNVIVDEDYDTTSIPLSFFDEINT